jgi:predicted lipid-binding transport protein (Tim44 family)
MTDPPPTRRTPPATAAAGGTAGPEHPEDRAGREPGELVTGLSPRQIIGGFALLAGLIIWLRRRGRGKG